MATPKITRFKGLNNVTDPLRLDLSWLVRADNVDITDSGAIQAREGYTLGRATLGTTHGAYNTNDFSRLFTIEGDSLVACSSIATPQVLRTGLAPRRMSWAEINDQVFFANGVDAGIINQDGSVLDWRWTKPAAPTLAAASGSLEAGLYQVRCAFQLADGRLTGASDLASLVLEAGSALQITSIPQVAGSRTQVYICPANGSAFQLATANAPAAMTWNQGPNALREELRTVGLDPLPADCDVIQFWAGKVCAAMYMPGAADQTVVWMSKPLAFHLFQLDTDGFVIKGRVLAMVPDDKGLVIATDRAIYVTDGTKLTQLADFGVVPGRNWAIDESGDSPRTLLWTTRGLCQALPFKNLTDQQVSVPPGTFAGGALVERDGGLRYLVALQQGGSAFNSRKASP